jgi:hypothetical protein
VSRLETATSLGERNSRPSDARRCVLAFSSPSEEAPVASRPQDWGLLLSTVKKKSEAPAGSLKVQQKVR